MRLIGRAFLLLVLALSALAVGGVFYLFTSVPSPTGKVRLAGPAKPIEIRRDRDGLVHIRAESARDGYFALGYVHAQDRLAQMEFQRRVAQGRLAELIGPAGVESDRFMRTLGIYRLATGDVGALAAETRAAAETYAAGVNAFMASHRGALPPEFVALRHRPEPWRPADSLVWGKLMALQLAGDFRGEALRARIADRLGQEAIKALWPAAGGPVTLAGLAVGDATWRALAAIPGLQGASNAWVVGGQRTNTGQPILANDPHLGLRAPGFWHLSRINTPDATIAGVTIPGVPFHILGHNGRVAWGMTTTNADIADLVVERIVPDQPDHYVTPGGTVPFEVREETILVRGGPPVKLRVRASRHGPIVSDIMPALATTGAGVALQATFLQAGDRTADAFRAMNLAVDAAGFDAALADFGGPPQNVHFADVDGAIGMRVAGQVPIRADGDGFMPADGSTATQRWTGMIPFDQMPTRMAGPGEVISNANNRVIGAEYPHFLSREWDPGYRARRLTELLDAPGRHRVDTSATIMADGLSLAATDLLPVLLPMTQETPATALALGLLRTWDGTMDRRRPEPMIFTAWLRSLVRGIFADELGDAFGDFWGLKPDVVHHVLSEDRRWCDDRSTTDRTEDCATIAAAALARAIEELRQVHGADVTGWRWGDAHEARFGPALLQRVPVVGSLLDVALPTDGGYYTLNRGAMRIASEATPYRNVHGAGLRAIYDLSDLDRSQFMIAIGQSGNPLSRHFSDLARPWRDFEWRTLPRMPPVDGSRLVLAPG